MTLAISKRKGTNAIEITRRMDADDRAGCAAPSCPRDVHVTVTRNYGETAEQKSNELLWHMFIAVFSVSILIWLTLGRREAAVVLVAIPVTLALTLFVFYLYGYTLNRITLFALIFSIGILVDDAIVVVENIVRHSRLAGNAGMPLSALAVRAVDEVGNPTILATLTVVAAILPMAFVGGLMGPYMRPIPVGATAAMMFSLVVAFVVTPWTAGLADEGRRRRTRTAGEDRFTALYRRVMARLIARPRRARWRSSAASAVALLASIALVPLGLVGVKMLPFDNKSEFQVIINMPEGTPLEQTARVAAELARETLKQPSVVNVQSYVGTSSPYNFNGLVRHYFMRQHAPPGRPAGEPGAEGRPVGAEPRHRQAGARDAAAGGPEVRRPASRSPRCRPARRCSRRSSPRCTARRRPARRAGGRGQADVRTHAGRRRHRVVRRARTAEGRAGGGPGEGRRGGPAARRDRRRSSGWPAPARWPDCSTTTRRARTCRSWCACRATSGRAPRPCGRSASAAPSRSAS